MRAPIVLFVCLTVPAVASGQGVTVYQLTSDSLMESGCIGPSPCDCGSLLIGPVTGTFDLELVGVDPPFEVYAVDNIAWVVDADPDDIVVTGSGTFRVDLDEDLQEMMLILDVNGETQEFVSVGIVFEPAGFPDALAIDVFSKLNMCLYDGFTIDAEPFLQVSDFTRGDADGNAVVNALVDSLFLLEFGFQGGTPPPCMEAADVDDSGGFNALVDVLYLLAHGFQGGPPPAAPYPICGRDSDAPGLGCGANGC